MQLKNKSQTSTRKFSIGITNLVLSTIFISVLSLALPMLTLQVYDRIIPHPESGTLPVLIGGVCVAVILDAILRLSRGWMIGWNGVCYEHALSCRAVDHMLSTDLAVFGGTGAGEHLNRLQSIPRLKDFHSGYTLVTFLELAFVPAFFALIAYIAGPVVFIPLLILGLFTATALWHGSCLRKTLEVRDRTDDNRYNFLIEALEGVHTIKSLALENRFIRRYENLEEKSTLANYRVTDNAARTFNDATLYSQIMTAAVITFGAIQVLNGHMTSGSLIAVVLLSGRIIQPMQRVLALWARYQDYSVAREKTDLIFAMPQQIRHDIKYEPACDGKLDLRDVGFMDTTRQMPLFRHVTLSLARGESVRISGAHGAGKTALLHIIAGLYTPSEGSVFVDGCPPSYYEAEARLRHVGYMTTKGEIFRGTIRDNITRFGLISENDARQITHILGIDKEVSTLPRGFDTFLEGMETDAIPPGLRQRIALARALAAKPRLILYDNADRNLDREGYRAVYTLLGRMREKVALVLVTDDRNIGRLADRHYRLDSDGLSPVQDFHDNVMYGRLRA